MKSPEQLKGAIRNISREKSLAAGEVLQIFLFERLIERLSLSPYQKQFILKGGLLIASMIGLSQRTTIDMDTTVKGLSMNEETMIRVIKEIIATNIDDGINFTFIRINPIRGDDDYNNFSATLKASYGKIFATLKIDITTGDEITPAEIDYNYPFLFEDKQVVIKAYPIETLLAEKYETILRRNVLSTRSRDLYDIYILYQLKENEVSWNTLKEAIQKTAKKRRSENLLTDYSEIIAEIENSDYQKRLWTNYQKENTYSKDISFSAICKVIKIIGDTINTSSEIE